MSILCSDLHFYDVKIIFISQQGIIQKLDSYQIHYWKFIVSHFRETTTTNWQSAICRKDVGEFKFPAPACVLTAALIQQQELIIAVSINICLTDSLIFIQLTSLSHKRFSEYDTTLKVQETRFENLVVVSI